MISIYAINKRRPTDNGEGLMVELRGLSNDNKPIVIGDGFVDNGSVFVEMDTQKIYFYDLDSSEWKGE